MQNRKVTKQSIKQIPIRVYNDSRNHYVSVLCQMSNLSFASGRFPDCLKYSCITLNFKVSSRNEIQNYKPISVLPFLSKLFVRCIYRRLHSFIMKFSILSPAQFWVLQGQSTQCTVSRLITFLCNPLDDKQITLMNLLIDRRK